jgi:thioredoxin reductase (NADPH)
MTTTERPELDPAALRELFLFESLDDAQLAWIGEHADVVDAHRLFVFIGAEPRTDWLDGVVERDDRGFVLSGPDLPSAPDSRGPTGWEPERDPFHLETSLPGVFAVGDVRGGSVKRVASAVGEGAMAVSLVHRWLENR